MSAVAIIGRPFVDFSFPSSSKHRPEAHEGPVHRSEFVARWLGLSVFGSAARFMNTSAPQPIPRALRVPLGCGLEVAGTGREVLAYDIVIQSHTQPRPVGNLDPSVIDDRRFGVLLHHGRPPGDVEGMVL